MTPASIAQMIAVTARAGITPFSMNATVIAHRADTVRSRAMIWGTNFFMYHFTVLNLAPMEGAIRFTSESTS